MLEILDCEQNSEAWYQARTGLPTASMFGTIMATGKGGGESKTRRSYLMRLAGEILTGVPEESYQNADMIRGHQMEPEAREAYAFVTDAEPTLVGFIRNGSKGASPDALIGANGLLEVKTKKASILVDLHVTGGFPSEHKAQCQGALWVAEREWIDLACYWPGLPIFIKRMHRDEAYIREIASAVDQFNQELAQVVEYMRRRGGMAVAA